MDGVMCPTPACNVMSRRIFTRRSYHLTGSPHVVSLVSYLMYQVFVSRFLCGGVSCRIISCCIVPVSLCLVISSPVMLSYCVTTCCVRFSFALSGIDTYFVSLARATRRKLRSVLACLRSGSVFVFNVDLKCFKS